MKDVLQHYRISRMDLSTVYEAITEKPENDVQNEQPRHEERRQSME
jgi:hypothetical protein